MFYALKNLSASVAFEVPEPWNWKESFVDYNAYTKEAFGVYAVNTATNHMFYSGFEGTTPTVRVRLEDNDPHRMHAMVVDYDGPFNGKPDVDKILKKPPTEFLPAYVSGTKSGNSRAIWLFEEPILLPKNPDAVSAFLAALYKKVRLSRWFPGIDEKAFKQCTQYYEAGKDWIRVSGYAIPSAMLHYWMSEATSAIRFGDWDQGLIPLEKAEAEIHKRWPNQWQGPFTIGTRCKRFWDPDGKNFTSAVLHKDGFQCFAGEKGFISWRDLFGTPWIEQFEADRMGPIRQRTWWDSCGNKFVFDNSGNNDWESYNDGQFRKVLRRMGIDDRRSKDEIMSDQDKFETDVMFNRIVRGVRPFLYKPKGLIDFAGIQVLNNSNVKVTPPVSVEEMPEKEFQKAGPKYFPFLYSLMSTFFDTERDPTFDQLTYFLSWLKHFYGNAYKQTPQPGQAMLIGGREGKGKSFLAQVIMRDLMGGYGDASQFLVEDSPWTNTLIEKPIFGVDDGVIQNDEKRLLRYGALLKKIVADKLFNYNGKYLSPGEVWWHGRAIITFNLDTTSMKIIPSMEISNRTKLSMLLASSHQIQFPPDQEVSVALVKQELGFFARFLLNMEIPESLLNKADTRYYIIPYHHPDLLHASQQSGPSQPILEMLQIWSEQYKTTHPTKEVWRGTMAHLYQLLMVSDGVANLVPRGGPQTLGKALSTLSSRGFPIRKLPIRREDHIQYWEIELDLRADIGGGELKPRLEIDFAESVDKVDEFADLVVGGNKGDSPIDNTEVVVGS